MQDDELMLLSWTQLTAILMLDADNDEYAAAQQEVASQLLERYQIEQMHMLSRSFDGYTISYLKSGEDKITTFPLEEVEELL